MNKSLIYFAVHRILSEFVVNLINIFSILNLYQIFNGSLLHTILPYVFIHIGFALILPFMARTVGKIGTRNSMVIGKLFFLLSIYPLSQVTSNYFMIPLGAWIILTVCAMTFYYLPIHYFLASHTTNHNRGSQLGSIRSVALISFIILPYFGGVISEYSGLTGITIAASVLFTLSLLPLAQIKNAKFIFTNRFEYFLSLKQVRELVRISVSTPLESQYSKFWVIYVFVLTGTNFIGFGVLYLLVELVNVLLSFFFGKFLDHHNRKRFIRLDAFVISLLWILRTFVRNIGGAFVSEVFYKLNYTLRDSAFSVITYDLLLLKDKSQQLDERIVIREVAINLTAAFSLLLGVIIITSFGFQTGFIAAGIFALFAVLI